MQSVEEILQRNSRVEMDKAWETSKTRRALIALITYLTAVTFLTIVGNENPFIHGLVPVGGYILSTLSLPPLKRLWLQHYQK